jgi:glutaconate CoA-transferase subunit B
MPNAGEIFVVMRRHDPSAFPAELDFCTSPSPVRAREAGDGIMPRGRGVTKVFTNLGVLSRQGPFDELELVSVHEGVTVDDVRAQTGWELKVADDLTVTAPPTGEEIHLLRDVIDKVRLYLR